MRYVRCAAVALALMVGIGRVDAAQIPTPPQIKRLKMDSVVAEQIGLLTEISRNRRVEIVACLVSYTVTDSMLVLHAIEQPDSARIVADSLTISTRDGKHPCRKGQPTIHSHVAQNGAAGPSETDSMTAVSRGIWNLLLVVYDNGWMLRLY